MSNYTRLHAEGTVDRGPSPIIFGDVAKLQHDQIKGKCVVIYDDFADLPTHTSAGAAGNYYTYQDTGVTIQQGTAVASLSGVARSLGTLEVGGNDADNDEGHIQFGSGAGTFRVDNASGNTGKVMFECRITKEDVTDANTTGFFVGLGTGPVATNYLVDNTAALIASKGFIGFLSTTDDGDAVDIVYQAANQTMQTVLANAAAITVNTFVKLGFLIDPFEIDENKQIKFYVNSADSGSYVTTTNMDAATFPEGEALIPMFLTKNGDGANEENKFKADWVCAAQYLSDEQ